MPIFETPNVYKSLFRIADYMEAAVHFLSSHVSFQNGGNGLQAGFRV